MEGRILEGKGGARAFRQTVNLLFFFSIPRLTSYTEKTIVGTINGSLLSDAFS